MENIGILQNIHGSNLPKKDLFTVKEVAAYFNCCIRTVQRWQKRKIINPLCINGRIFIPREEILRLLNK